MSGPFLCLRDELRWREVLSVWRFCPLCLGLGSGGSEGEEATMAALAAMAALDQTIAALAPTVVGRSKIALWPRGRLSASRVQ